MCVNHEESEYVKGSLDYSDLTNTKSKNLHRSTKTTPPAKRMEQEQVYQWSLIMFGELITNRSCVIKDGYDAIKQLKTPLTRTTKNNKEDELETCMNKMFGKDEEAKTDHLQTVEVIEDDYNGYNPTVNEEDANEDKVTDSNGTTGRDGPSAARCVPKMALGNIFILGVDKMNELNIPKQRERKKID